MALKAVPKVRPNILVIFGDDIGIPQISAYTRADGLSNAQHRSHRERRRALYGFLRPAKLHRRARILHPRPGAVPHRAAHDRHARRSARHHGLDADDRRPAQDRGYTTGQFGKNHLGDQDEHLPTNHGFDEFFGNLYHLNAEEEPEGYFYPKDPSFKKKYGPRGVIHSYANGQRHRRSRTPVR